MRNASLELTPDRLRAGTTWNDEPDKLNSKDQKDKSKTNTNEKQKRKKKQKHGRGENNNNNGGNKRDN